MTSYLRISNKIFLITPHSSQEYNDLYLNLFSQQENKCRDDLKGHCKQYFQDSREEKELLNPSNTVILLVVLFVAATDQYESWNLKAGLENWLRCWEQIMLWKSKKEC